MKRILFFLLLLLNLQITIEKGFWGITPGEVSAQRMRDDHITDPYIWGGLYYCDWCRQCCGDFQTYELHKKTCLFRPIECFFCGMTYFAFMPHICPNCIFCGFPLDKCICGGVQAFGKYGVELGDWKELKRVMAEAWDIFQLEMSTMTNAPTIIPNTPTNKPFERPNPRITMDDVFSGVKQGNIHLVKNGKLPNQLPIQKAGDHDCVIMSFAFSLAIQGYDYQKEYTRLYNRASPECDLKTEGMLPSQITRLSYEHPIYIFDNPNEYTFNAIVSYLEQGYPVIACKTDKGSNHVITIFGYDNQKNLYVAAGNPEQSANIIKASDVRNLFTGPKELYVIK